MRLMRSFTTAGNRARKMRTIVKKERRLLNADSD
jgi:hypothetical protein